MSGWEFFDEHQAVVVREATARLVPGPADDDGEAGSPGAREADVVRYVDTLLAALDGPEGRLFSGGPWSDRAGGSENHFETTVSPTPAQRAAWERRIGEWRRRYREGVELLDRLAGGDFGAARPEERDRVLMEPEAESFRDLLFGHAIEGMYSAPEYGGNRGLAGWSQIGFRGDVQPTGYAPHEVSDPDGPDPASPDLLERVRAEFALAVRLVAGGGQSG